MAKFGFEELLKKEVAGYIITSFKFPKDPNFDFKKFYDGLYAKGIYNLLIVHDLLH